MRAAHAGSVDRVQTIVEDTCLLSDRRECGQDKEKKSGWIQKEQYCARRALMRKNFI